MSSNLVFAPSTGCNHALQYTTEAKSYEYLLVTPNDGTKPYNFVCNKCLSRGAFPNYQCLPCQYDLCMACYAQELGKDGWCGTSGKVVYGPARQMSTPVVPQGLGLVPVPQGLGLVPVPQGLGLVPVPSHVINAVARPFGYTCVPVSWEDATRSKNNGALSSTGPNIADVRLWQKDGTLLYTCRSQNWNEKVVIMSSKDISVVVGNGNNPAQSQNQVISLHDLLQTPTPHLGYSGLTSTNLLVPQDDQVSVRFQTVFIPGSSTEFCTEVYSYNTVVDHMPRNMLLLATPQGTSVQLDGRDRKRLYYHSVANDGSVHRYWLEAERSNHGVGQEQVENTKERNDAIARGKAVSIKFGPTCMGSRFNAQLLIQVPLKQEIMFNTPPSNSPGFGFGGFGAPSSNSMGFGAPSSNSAGFGFSGFGVTSPSSSSFSFGDSSSCTGTSPRPCGTFGFGSGPAPSFGITSSTLSFGATPVTYGNGGSPSVAQGISNAARVSRGSQVDVWRGVCKPNVERDPKQHITVTVTLYYTCSSLHMSTPGLTGVVPSSDDIMAAINDMNRLYSSSGGSRSLVSNTIDSSQQTPCITSNDYFIPLPTPFDESKSGPETWTRLPLPTPFNQHVIQCPKGHSLQVKPTGVRDVLTLVCKPCHFSVCL